jgi:hypothetical protein
MDFVHPTLTGKTPALVSAIAGETQMHHFDAPLETGL